MRQVSKKKFHEIVGSMEGVTSSVVGDYPYNSEWLTKGGTIVGKIKSEYGVENKYPLVVTYFVST